MARVPSDKQARFAIAISEKLGIPLPDHETAKEYWQYIQNNKDAYYEKVNEEKSEVAETSADSRESATEDSLPSEEFYGG